MIKVCIVGYGGIARVHKAGYRAELEAKGVGEFVAACDINPDRFERRVTTNIAEDTPKEVVDFKTYTDLDLMLETEQPDIVTITLPTYLHKEVATYVLRKGYNVMCEKPMSLTYEDCLEMLEVAKETGKQLMVGQCLHFFAEYEYLKEVIDSGKYGRVRSAFFQRLSAPPVWGWENWYMDTAKSGGCLQDLHIHDVDFARYAFGEPKKVSCTSKSGWSDYESAFTTMWYDDFAVTAIGDWSLENHGFSYGFRVAFEKGVVECIDGKVTEYPCDSAKFEVQLPAVNGYGAEVAYLGEIIEKGIENKKNPVESAATSIKLIETLKKSADMGGAIVEFNA